VPENVKPGEWGFGHVYFGTDDLPADTQFDLKVSGSQPRSVFASVDLSVQEVNTVPGSVGGKELALPH
jgi:hypothetical protein